MSILHYLASPMAALFLGMAYYLWRRNQKIRALIFVGGALVLLGTEFHLALSVAGILVLLFALFRGPKIVIRN